MSDWSSSEEEDNTSSALPVPVVTQHVAPQRTAPQQAVGKQAVGQQIAIREEPVKQPEIINPLLIFIPARLYLAGTSNSLKVFVTVTWDVTTHKKHLMVTNELKQYILVEEINSSGEQNGLGINYKFTDGSLASFSDSKNGKDWTFQFASMQESFRVACLLAVCFSSQIDYAQFPDKFPIVDISPGERKGKRCKLGHFAQLQYHVWHIKSRAHLGSFRPDFDPFYEMQPGSVTDEKQTLNKKHDIKISDDPKEKSAEWRHVLLDMKVAGSRVVVLPTSKFWGEAFDVDCSASDLCLVVFLQLVGASKKRKFKRKKEEKSGGKKGGHSVEGSGAAELAQPGDVQRPAVDAGRKKERPVESPSTSSSMALIVAPQMEEKDIDGQIDDTFDLLKHLDDNVSLLPKNQSAIFKQCLTQFYEDVSTRLQTFVEKVNTDGVPETVEDPANLIRNYTEQQANVTARLLKRGIRETLSKFNSISSENDDVGSSAKLHSVATDLSTSVKSLCETQEHLIKSASESSSSKLELDLIQEQLKSSKQEMEHLKQASTQSNSNNEAKIQELESQIQELSKENDDLALKVEEMKVFEKGVHDIRALYDESIKTQADLEDELDDLSMLQQGYKLTWVPSKNIESCMVCQTRFGFMTKKRHCRYCGRVVCSSCSPDETEIPDLGYDRKVRICKRCFESVGGGS